mmetsp:Transcript_13187/g.23642  ORF Transcript_13187/g.23642 Transcript_13187/m.23642 type:complete len:379 (-) Transcript_13187:333-1469(-)
MSSTPIAIGVPKEIKNHEYRVGMVPSSVREVAAYGHKIFIETNAGMGIGLTDKDYIDAGATILSTAAEVFAVADMIVKVKEPQAVERAMLRPGQLLFTYLHLAADHLQTEELISSKSICIAYETVTDRNGLLPLLAPMSEVAGRMSVQAGAQCLEKARGGCGMLLGGIPGVEPAKVTIIGGGVVGTNAAQIAVGMGADVVVIDRSVDALRRLNAQFGSRVKTVYSTAESVERHCLESDLVIGGVLIPGAKAPKLVSADLVSRMKPGSAVVDVAIDQGGCVETSKPTTHAAPTFIVDNVVHYCVANMPGAVARTSTYALNNATLPYIIKLANGWRRALMEDQHLLAGLNVANGRVTCEHVASALGYPYTPAREVIEALS